MYGTVKGTFIIAGINVDKRTAEELYFSMDNGAYCWTSDLFKSIRFPSRLEALRFVDLHKDFNQVRETPDGKFDAPIALASLTELNNDKLLGNGKIFIKEVIVRDSYTVHFEAKLEVEIPENSFSLRKF